VASGYVTVTLITFDNIRMLGYFRSRTVSPLFGQHQIILFGK